jgi:hypothetical protein
MKRRLACPTHQRAASWWCAKCDSRLSWLRLGLLECKCGTPLLNPPRDTYSEPEYWLLDLIRQKALGDQIFHRRDLVMPVEQFERMSLQFLLSVVRILGERRIAASRSTKPPMGRHLLQAAAKVLIDWPTNFEILLKDIYHQGSEDGLTVLSGDFANIHEVVSERIALRFQH